MSDQSAVAGEQLLSAQYAAIYSYGLVGARLPESEQPQAAAALAAHRAARDQVILALDAEGVLPPPAAPAYDTGPVESPEQARELAVRVESALVPRWSAWAGTQSGSARGFANTQAQACALRAVAWGAPATAFPGRRESGEEDLSP